MSNMRKKRKGIPPEYQLEERENKGREKNGKIVGNKESKTNEPI